MRNRWLSMQPSRMRNRSHLHSSWRDLRAYQEARHAAYCTLHPSKPLHPQIVREHLCITLLVNTAFYGRIGKDCSSINPGTGCQRCKTITKRLERLREAEISHDFACRLYPATEPYQQTVVPALRRTPSDSPLLILPILFSDRASSLLLR